MCAHLWIIEFYVIRVNFIGEFSMNQQLNFKEQITLKDSNTLKKKIIFKNP